LQRYQNSNDNQQYLSDSISGILKEPVLFGELFSDSIKKARHWLRSVTSSKYEKLEYASGLDVQTDNHSLTLKEIIRMNEAEFTG
jgi:hypothetical protein